MGDTPQVYLSIGPVPDVNSLYGEPERLLTPRFAYLLWRGLESDDAIHREVGLANLHPSKWFLPYER